MDRVGSGDFKFNFFHPETERPTRGEWKNWGIEIEGEYKYSVDEGDRASHYGDDPATDPGGMDFEYDVDWAKITFLLDITGKPISRTYTKSKAKAVLEAFSNHSRLSADVKKWWDAEDAKLLDNWLERYLVDGDDISENFVGGDGNDITLICDVKTAAKKTAFSSSGAKRKKNMLISYNHGAFNISAAVLAHVDDDNALIDFEWVGFDIEYGLVPAEDAGIDSLVVSYKGSPFDHDHKMWWSQTNDDEFRKLVADVCDGVANARHSLAAKPFTDIFPSNSRKLKNK